MDLDSPERPTLDYQRREPQDQTVRRRLERSLVLLGIVSGLAKFVLALAGLYTLVLFVAYLQGVGASTLDLVVVHIGIAGASAIVWVGCKLMSRRLVAIHR